MINSNTEIAHKRHIRTMPVFGNVQAGPNGELTFSVTIQPEMLDPVMGLVQMFTGELRRSMATRDRWAQRFARENIERESNRIEFKQLRRLSLSVYRRTGSVHLAARAGGWLISDVRMFIQHADVLERKEMMRARNARICNMKEKGWSCRDIAARFSISPAQVSRVVKRRVMTHT